MSGIEIVVHSERCMGSGRCRLAAPSVFGTGDDGWVALIDRHPPNSAVDALIQARDDCPVAAIEVLDEHGQSLA
ncbi:ferredoxin [Nocardia sp. CA-107356]|uniref:ferredoxin n=1 Tax=Nocardia sp. CA-107356 TaxID=3239972 RepID=UPI003D92BE07